jgi:hypothetical protein
MYVSSHPSGMVRCKTVSDNLALHQKHLPIPSGVHFITSNHGKAGLCLSGCCIGISIGQKQKALVAYGQIEDLLHFGSTAQEGLHTITEVNSP